MKTTVVLFIGLVTLLPLSANATTLTITSGGAVLNDELFLLGAGVGSWIAFAGDDFSVWQLKEPTSFQLIPAFGVEPFVQSIGFYSGRFSGAGVVQVGNQQ